MSQNDYTPPNIRRILEDIDKENREIVRRYMEGYVTKEDVETHCVSALSMLVDNLPRVEE